MRVLFRADAGALQGTGHVMRCLTLAEELIHRGHEVHLMSSDISIDWLALAVEQSGVEMHPCAIDELPRARIADVAPDWVVVDSYRIDAAAISELATEVPLLAIVDGDDRSIRASLYLDQNLGADEETGRRSPSRFLAGAVYALVRTAVLDVRRAEPWKSRDGRARVLCFMGGTDATGSIVGVATAIADLDREVDLTVVAPIVHHSAILESVTPPTALRLLAPTPELPSLFADADVIVSATGTSAWDICSLGIPAVFVAVVENQRASLAQLLAKGLAMGVDATGGDARVLADVGPQVALLLDDQDLRRALSDASRSTFDGGGATRVSAALEDDGNRVLLEW